MRLVRGFLLTLGAAISLLAALLALFRPDVVFLLLGFLSPSSDGVVAVLALAAAGLAGVTFLLGRLPGWQRAFGLGVLLLAAAALIALGIHRYGGYRTRGVGFESAGARLAGTLYLPRRAGPHPGVVLTPGSGVLTREFYRFYADRFARAGFAVLAYDKRGIGDSGGHYENENNSSAANLDTLALDLVAAAEWLAGQGEVGPGGVGVWGISQAGWVAPIAASRTGGIAWLALVSGPAVPTREENVYSELAGEDQDHLGTQPPLLAAGDVDRVLDTLPVRGFDPEPYLQRLSQPSLWVYGAWDRSVPAERSARILRGLGSGRAGRVTVRVYADAGHLLLVSGNRGHGPLPTFAPGFWNETLRWMRDVAVSPGK